MEDEDALWEAVTTAPKFGTNAKAIILASVARDGNGGEEEPREAPGEIERRRAERHEELSQALKSGPALLRQLPPKLRPLMPYQPRSRLPRVTRQLALDRLAGQHLALLAATRKTPAETVVADEPSRREAFARAFAQEASLFSSATTASGYQMRASRLTALDWAPAAAEERERAAKEEKEARRRAREAEQATHSARTPGGIGSGAGTATGGADSASGRADRPAEGRRKVLRVVAVEEADLDWGGGGASEGVRGGWTAADSPASPSRNPKKRRQGCESADGLAAAATPATAAAVGPAATVSSLDLADEPASSGPGAADTSSRPRPTVTRLDAPTSRRLREPESPESAARAASAPPPPPAASAPPLPADSPSFRPDDRLPPDPESPPPTTRLPALPPLPPTLAASAPLRAPPPPPPPSAGAPESPPPSPRSDEAAAAAFVDAHLDALASGGLAFPRRVRDAVRQQAVGKVVRAHARAGTRLRLEEEAPRIRKLVLASLQAILASESERLVR